MSAKIQEKLLNVQTKLPAVPKNGRNPHTKSAYATLSDILTVLRPALAAEGLVCSQRTANDGDGWVLVTTISDRDGGTVSFDFPLMLDAGAKNQMQALGSAVTYACRYALNAYFCLAADVDDDAESAAAQRSVSRTQVHTSEPQSAADRSPALAALAKLIDDGGSLPQMDKDTARKVFSLLTTDAARDRLRAAFVGGAQ